MDAVEGVFGAQPLASSEAGELRALLANDAIERVEDVSLVVGDHPWSECAGSGKSYTL